jgi:hypothetical protein
MMVDKLLLMSLCSSAAMKPGEVVKRFSDEDKEIIKELTSEDFNRRVK